VVKKVLWKKENAGDFGEVFDFILMSLQILTIKRLSLFVRGD
jgi:hypothetical protein